MREYKMLNLFEQSNNKIINFVYKNALGKFLIFSISFQKSFLSSNPSIVLLFSQTLITLSKKYLYGSSLQTSIYIKNKELDVVFWLVVVICVSRNRYVADNSEVQKWYSEPK